MGRNVLRHIQSYISRGKTYSSIDNDGKKMDRN